MSKSTVDFVVEGVELEDGSRTTLFSADNSAECRDWLTRYTRRLDDDGKAGGWSLIEVYDVRGEDAERLWYWAAEETEEEAREVAEIERAHRRDY